MVSVPDSSTIDGAIIAVLSNDATLKALMPDGVWFDEGPANLTAFVLVSLIAEVTIADIGVFRAGGGTRRGIEDYYYDVIAKARTTSAGNNAKAAAYRIDQLLEDQALTATGYTWMTTHRVERIRAVEVDDLNTSIHWQQRGGRYRVQMAVAEGVSP